MRRLIIVQTYCAERDGEPALQHLPARLAGDAVRRGSSGYPHPQHLPGRGVHHLPACPAQHVLLRQSRVQGAAPQQHHHPGRRALRVHGDHGGPGQGGFS